MYPIRRIVILSAKCTKSLIYQKSSSFLVVKKSIVLSVTILKISFDRQIIFFSGSQKSHFGASVGPGYCKAFSNRYVLSISRVLTSVQPFKPLLVIKYNLSKIQLYNIHFGEGLQSETSVPKFFS